jgi:hypothetical protein
MPIEVRFRIVGLVAVLSAPGLRADITAPPRSR